MILYHASKNPNLALHSKSPMWFTFAESTANEFGEDFKSAGYYVYKVKFWSSARPNIYDKDCDKDSNYVEIAKNIQLLKEYGFEGHFETEGGDTQICIYNPALYCEIVSRSEKI